MSFRFSQPWFALFFCILPILVFFLMRRQPITYVLSSLESFRDLPRTFSERFRRLDGVCFVLGCVALILALMRPQWGHEVTEHNEAAIAIMVAIDASRSMAALDFTRNEERVDRLTIEKEVLDAFIERRSADQIGMVIFGELAFTQAPLTQDHAMLRNLLARAKIGMAGDGTAIGDGLALAVKRLEKSAVKSKIIILVTDGENSAGRLVPEQAADIARDLGIKVYTIGIGTTGPVPFPEQTPWGTRTVMVEFPIDEKTLADIADKTGGRYFNATSSAELEKIYETIDQLEKTEVASKTFFDYREWYPPFACAGLFLMVLVPILRIFIFKRWMTC